MTNNKKYKVGITGQSGFVGTHLYNTLNLFPSNFELILYNKSYFQNESELDDFVSNCDVIIHLASMNRHEDQNVIYETNIKLVQLLVESLERTESTPQIIFSSSTQEERDNLYGKSKKEGRFLFQDWANKNNAKLVGLIIPNVFGPFGKPFYNSFIATFCYQLNNRENPKIEVDGEVNLIYVDELVQNIIELVQNEVENDCFEIKPTSTHKVSEVLNLLNNFKNDYLDSGNVPKLNSNFELQLFNTFRSFINLKNHYPVSLTQHTDNRGSFVEIIRPEIGGQFSFSTTFPSVTRGNHFHTRKIERFAVIKGKALIQLRKIGTDEILNFELDGEKPSYVDMPIWYTHNIKNIGNDILYTNFWINEAYNPDDADTYFQEV